MEQFRSRLSERHRDCALNSVGGIGVAVHSSKGLIGGSLCAIRQTVTAENLPRMAAKRIRASRAKTMKSAEAGRPASPVPVPSATTGPGKGAFLD